MNAITFKDVKYKYPRTERWALQGLNVSIPYNKCTLIVGPTGSGKSTFILLARGLHKQFGGELKGKILLHGKDMNELDFLEITRMGVGWVGQNPAINLHQLTVRDEILSSPIYFNLPWEQCTEIADKMMEWLSISELANRAPSELSGGQMQRVAIAAALTMGEIGGERKLLLLDEPSSFLDPVGKEELVELLLSLKKEGITIVVVTHDVQTFIGLADKMILIVEGKKVKEGTPRDLLYSEEFEEAVGSPLLIKVAKTIPEAKEVKPLTTEEVLAFIRPENKVKSRSRKNESKNVKSAISFHNVSFEYAEEKIFEELNCEIPANRITALVGNNGSGKTTLVKLGLGLLKPQKGKILLLGKNPSLYSAKELASKVAYITQIPKDMFIANTVREECMITPTALGMSNIEEIVESSIKKANLEKLRNSPVDSLSGGEQRLLTLASTAFVTDAEVLILDEPEYGVDLNTWWYIFDILRNLKEQGKTILMLTHFIDATFFCDYVIVLSNGKIIDEGAPIEVYKREKIKEARIKPPSIMPVIEKNFGEDVEDLLDRIKVRA